jgi:hypothetical protein
MRRAPGSCNQHNPGARISISGAKAERPTKLPAEAKSTPVTGEGVLMRYSSRPSDCCKGRSDPITENSSDAPPRFGPLATDDRARRVAELRTALSAPAFLAHVRRGEEGSRP